ncbi:MAG: hypothetical protein DI626_08830 [Micavibrio aeruginosavorus]|uniref:Uncharacterized protein n=1 Tax=Micavibrio aeruginosavorus TaxID=349221 RepID=A0A2W4ZSI0_9BACT|nr:MAG: hypothetical protein DI626_08830 [Micavibrio aeruginosavorus]
MIKALAIISGPRQRTTEYMNGMRDGYYDLVFLMDAATKKPFAFMTLQNERRMHALTQKLSPVFTVAAKDTLNDPKAFEREDAYVQKNEGRRALYMVCKTDHLGLLGFDQTKIHVFMPEKPGDVYRYYNGKDGPVFKKDEMATRTLMAAYREISSSPASRLAAPRYNHS